MDVKIQHIELALENGTALTPLRPFPISQISTDTRTLEKDALFVALVGERFNGHDYLEEAAKKGASHFVVSQSEKIPEHLKESANFIEVPDTLQAYGDLAAFYRKRFKVPVIGITGSSGKTTTKELVGHVLSKKFRVIKNEGTENNLVGVPKTIFKMDAKTEVLILEMGTNFPGEIPRLSWIASPNIGVLTQIGYSHLQGLGSLEGVKKEKLGLLDHIDPAGMLYLNGEDPMLADVEHGKLNIRKAGFKPEEDDFYATNIRSAGTQTIFQFRNEEVIEIPLLGKHNVVNSLFAIAIARSLGMEMPEIVSALKDFGPVAGRLACKNMDGILFIDDTYNSNPTSFSASLETLKNLEAPRRGVVFGDMLELGGEAENLHRQAGIKLAQCNFDFVVAVGDLSKYAADQAVKSGYPASKIFHVNTSLEAGKLCRDLARSGDRVLVKGSRGMKMEKVFECFTTSSIR